MELNDSKKCNKCSYCEKFFSFPSEQKRHERSHYKQFKCNYCCKEFNFLSAQLRHEKQHQRSEHVHCDECNRKFTDDTLLKRHKKYAHKGTFTCTQCNSSFGSELALNVHTKIHISEDQWKYKCTYDGCTKAFKFPHHLKRHVMIHSNKKQYHCNVCGKGFIQAQHFKSHLATHNPDEWFPCSVSLCEKKFPTAYSLKRHLITHGKKNILSSDKELINLDLSITSEVNSREFDDLLTIKSADNVIKSADHMTSSKTDVNLLRNGFTSCKDMLDGCLMSGNSEISDNCLCAQITQCGQENHNHDKAQSDFNKNIVSIKSESGKLNYSPDHNNGDYNKEMKTKSLCCHSENISHLETNPVIEFRIDGSIKIKELFDSDIKLEQDEYKEHNENNLDNQPEIQYSCKEILGSCIVSGNSSTGEGCICAKMSIKENDTYSQEIQEILPFL